MKIKHFILLGTLLFLSSYSYASNSFEIGDSYDSVISKIKQNAQCQNLTDLNKKPKQLHLYCKNKSLIGLSEKFVLSFEQGQLHSVESQSNGLNLGPIKLKPKEIVAWFKRYFSNLVLI